MQSFIQNIKDHKEIIFIFLYFISVIVISIFLVLDYWHPIPIQNFDYAKFDNITKFNNGTQIEEKSTVNQTMSVTKHIIKHDPSVTNNSQKPLIETSRENGTVILNLKSNFAINTNIDREFQLILLSLLFGIIGGATHGLASLVTYVGNKKYDDSWVIWYFGRPAIGGIIAIIFYLLIRGGILSINAQPSDLNYFGIAAISVTAGLMATEATRKLRDIFMTLFGTNENREKGDELGTKKDAKIILPFSQNSIKVGEELPIGITVFDYQDRPLKEKEINVNFVDNQNEIELLVPPQTALKTDSNGKVTIKMKGLKPGSVIANIYLKENIAIMDTIEIKIVS